MKIQQNNVVAQLDQGFISQELHETSSTRHGLNVGRPTFSPLGWPTIGPCWPTIGSMQW